MSNENQLMATPQASQEVIDAAKRESHAWLNPETWRTMQLVAATFIQSGAMPKSMDTAPKLIVALQAGKEAGLQPIESVNSFYFVNGKVSMYGEMAITQVIRAGHKIVWGKCDDESATVKIIRGDGKGEMESTFTMSEATKKGLHLDSYGKEKAVWKKFPENMLRFKAFHLCTRFICPEALHGVPIKEVVEGDSIEEAKEEKKPEIKVEQTGGPHPCAKEPVKEESLSDAINKPKEEPIVEVMPPAEKPAKSKAAKIMEDAKIKKEQELQSQKGLWPEEVCAYLEFIQGIPDTDLKPDIIQLKADSNGKFKGYDAYPSLRQEIDNLSSAQQQ